MNNGTPLVATGRLHDGEDLPLGTTVAAAVRETGLHDCTLSVSE